MRVKGRVEGEGEGEMRRVVHMQLNTRPKCTKSTDMTAFTASQVDQGEAATPGYQEHLSGVNGAGWLDSLLRQIYVYRCCSRTHQHRIRQVTPPASRISR